ncbi:MAG: phosphoadenylyl-sulfate reductase [Deltaproteobacteria bacterium]|nr:phosphoadenylyl-sulfate reductase [Deltaproteobacteria bacterium]
MTSTELATWAAALEERPPQEILALAAERFAPRLTFATGFGREGCALVDMVARFHLAVDLFTLDTGVLFPETYALWSRLERHYGLTIRAVRPRFTLAEADQVHRLWESDPDRCCELRKVTPLRAELSSFDAWVTAIRREQTPERAGARPVEWDAKFGLVKVNPLVRWTEADLDAYLTRHGVPVNPLHAQGYPSIGCQPCTTKVAAGEDPRAGRWRGREKTECGLHTRHAWAAAASPSPSSPPNPQEP